MRPTQCEGCWWSEYGCFNEKLGEIKSGPTMLMGTPITGRIPHERTPEFLARCVVEGGHSAKRDHYRKLFGMMGFEPAEIEEQTWGMVGTHATKKDTEEESND